VPANTSDFSSFVRTLKDKGVTGVTSAMAEPLLIQLLQTADQLGVDLKVCSSQDAMTSKTLKGLGKAAANYYTGGLPPATESSSLPGMKDFFADMKAQAKAGDKAADPENLRASAFRGWLGPRFIERVAPSIQGEISGATLTAALQKQSALNADMFGTIDFTKPGALQPGVRNYKGYLAHWNVDSGQFDLLQDEPVDALQVMTAAKK
jgi:ABC-type branched-subunit amino acid transport system substrate-binding protein